MALEKKTLAGGGMDMDTDERYVAKNDYRYALNCRINAVDEDSAGTVENIRANKLINNANIGALDICIGAYEDLDNQVVIYFILASSGDHSIFLYNPQSETVETIIQSSFLNFDKDHLITGVNVVGTEEDKFPRGLLYWTDDINPPRKLNIDKAIKGTANTGGYASFPLSSWASAHEVMDVIKHPPVNQPFTQGDASSQTTSPPAQSLGFYTDPNTTTNQLKEKSWQFKYRYVYDDGEISSWSPMSLMLSNNVFQSTFNIGGNMAFNGNYIPISFNSGMETVKRIQISARNSNGLDDFILVSDIKKSDVQERVYNGYDIGVATQQTTLADKTTYQFYFYNDSIYSTVDVVESRKLYNDVPQLAKAQDVVDGNRLVYGNVVSGYDVDSPMNTRLIGGQNTTLTIPSIIYGAGMTYRVDTDWDNPDSSTPPNRQNRATIRIDISLPPITAGAIGVYNISINDFKFSKGVLKNRGSFSADRGEIWAGVINCNYVSPVFNANSGNIAQMMATQLNNTQGSNWTVNMIGGNIPGTLNQNGIVNAILCGGGNDNLPGTVFTGINISGGNLGWSAPNNTTLRLRIRTPRGGLYRWGGSNGSYVSESWNANSVGGSGQWGGSASSANIPSISTLINDPATTPTAGSIITNNTTNINHVIHRDHNFLRADIRARVDAGFDAGTWQVSPNITIGGTTGYFYDTPNLNWKGCALQTNLDSHPMSINVTNLGTQSFLNNVLNNTNNVGNFSTLTEVNPLTTNIPTAINGFKTGANHRFGLVYYDRGNRSSSVKLSNTSSVYIPRIAESGFNGTWSIGWEINHDPPVWATHYQWVYGGNTLANDFISFVTGGFYDGTFAAHIPTPPSQIASGDYSGNILLDITNIKRFRNSEGGILSYDWEEGDIIRFVRDAQDNALPNNQDWEFKVLGVVGQTEGMPSIDVSGNLQGGSNSSGVFLNEDREYLVLSREAALTPLLNTVNANAATFQNYTIEIYSPSKRVEEEDILYYEFGQKYDISNGLHDGETQDQTQINGVAGTGATGTFTRGDVYLRLRASKSSKPFTPVESFHSSDLFKSDYYDKGRPNALLEDFKQTRKHSTCFYSEQYIANTHINGLSSFFPDVSFQEFERSYNSIQKLHSRDNQLIIFQEDKVSKSLVNRNIIYNIDGSGNVATSDTVLSQTVPYLGNYGICRNPESFAANGNKMYFVDIKRGVVLRLSLDGMTPISEYKMKDYFTDKCEEILKYYNPKTYNIFGVYDAKFGEYVVAFDWIRVKTGSEPGGGGGGQGAKLALPPSPPVFNSSTTYTVLMDRETVGFCEYSNRWNSFYSFYPEMMVESGVGFVSFYNGALWHHNRGLDLSDNPLYNAWYGYGVTSELTLVSNDAPSNNKIYNAISEEADDVWSVIVNTKNGQTTNLIKTDFDTKENIHYSQLYNDTNSPGGLLEGDKIRNTSALFKLWTNINTLTRLFAVNFNITPSYRSNK